MSQLINRYIHEVVRHLPALDQEEVKLELEANIYDMLPGDPSEEDITTVLEGLGAPERLATQYQPEKSYLISPMYYHQYIRMLKKIVPLVGIICLCVGFFIGTMEAINDGILNTIRMTAEVMGHGIALSIGGMFHALVWTTISYVIAERSEFKYTQRTAWTIRDLPEEIIPPKQQISLSDSIADFVLTLIGTTVVSLVALRIIPTSVILRTKDIHIQNIFTNEFLTMLLPMAITVGILGIATAIAKMIYRKWNLTVFINSIVYDIVSLIFFLILLHRSNMFTTEFIHFIQNLDFKLPTHALFNGQGVGQPTLTIISAIVILITALELASSLYKWVKYQWPDKGPEKK